MSDTTARLPRTGTRYLHEPAWRGHDVAPVDLVLEGGAMRGQFTAGVLDAFMDRGLFCERTVGVSAAGTPTLSPVSKATLIPMMYLGRVGPLTLALALAHKSTATQKHLRYPEEKIMIG